MTGKIVPQTFFFDLDGTLTDPFLGITNCIRFACAELDVPAPQAAELGWCIGPPLRASFVQLVGETQADRAVELYRERFVDVGIFENSKYSGIDELLSYINNIGSLCYVASSKPVVFVKRILKHFELTDYFVEAYGSELSGARADKTELLAWALGETGADASRSVMIGDRKHDAVGALNNGLRAWGVGWGYGSEEELVEAGVEVVFADVGEMLEAIRGVKAGGE